MVFTDSWSMCNRFSFWSALSKKFSWHETKVAFRDVPQWSRTVCNGCIFTVQFHCTADQDFAICQWNVRMRLGVLPLVFWGGVFGFFFFCSSVTVKKSATHTPSMSHSTCTTIVLNCPRALNCKVHVQLWIFFPPKSELFRCGVQFGLKPVEERSVLVHHKGLASPWGESHSSDHNT